MQICSWYTEHSKPLPRLFFFAQTISYFFPNELLRSLILRGASLGMGHLDGKKKWGKVSGPEKERAKGESRCHCRGCEFYRPPPTPHPQPPLASHWHKGLRPASLDSFCLEPRHSKAKGGYQLFKWPLLFPACPVAKFIKADKGIWLNYSFVMPYLEHSQSENQTSWSMVLSMYSTPLLTRSLASHQHDHWTSAADAPLPHTALPRHTSFIRTYLSQMPIHRSSQRPDV